MNILYARDFKEIDGTYLLLLRLAKKFAALGHNVYYLQYDNDDAGILAEMGKYATLLSFSALQQGFAAGEPMPDIDVIQPILDGDRLIEAITVIKGKWFPAAKFVIGIYHPRAFINKSRIGLTPDSRIYAAILKKVGGRNLIFMHDSMLDQHAQHLKVELPGANIINLPVEIPEQPALRSNVARLRIVSIGRLVRFKTYSSKILPALKKLREEGFRFEYYIYGDGPDREQLAQEINDAGLAADVHLMGTIEPTQLKNVLANAGLFLGVGTALIQAAGWCVPSLIGIDTNPTDTSYGWISNCHNTLGDLVPGQPEYHFYDLLGDYLALDDAGYNTLSIDCYESVKKYYSLDAIALQYQEVYEKAESKLNFKMNSLAKLVLRIKRQFYKPFLDKHFATK